jgi:hypothetical protein
MQRLDAAALEDELNGCVEVVDEDLEVHHLRLPPRLLGPDRGPRRCPLLGCSG